MFTNQRPIARNIVAVLMTFVMLNVYVLMGTGTSRASTISGEAESNSGKLLTGRLALADQQAIFVNGSEAVSGTTIFSGMRLQSPDGVNASVSLGSLGLLSLEPGSDMTLEFSAGRVAVRVAAGNATLTTPEGVEATLTAADGNVLKSENRKAGVLSTSAAAAPKMSNRRKALWWIVGIAAVVVIVIVAVEVSDDDSPSNP